MSIYVCMYIIQYTYVWTSKAVQICLEPLPSVQCTWCGGTVQVCIKFISLGAAVFFTKFYTLSHFASNATWENSSVNCYRENIRTMMN